MPEWTQCRPADNFNTTSVYLDTLLEGGEGVAFGTANDMAALKGKRKGKIALLLQKDEDTGGSQRIAVRALTRSGITKIVQAYIVQCGTVKVSPAATTTLIEIGVDVDSTLVFRLEADKSILSNELWTHLFGLIEKGTKIATSARFLNWIRENVNGEAYDISPLRGNKTGTFYTATFRSSEKVKDRCLKASGFMGIFLALQEQTYSYKHVWLPADASIFTGATTLAQRLRCLRANLDQVPRHLGVVRNATNGSLGIRCKESDLAVIHDQVKPGIDLRIGERYNLHGVPDELEPTQLLQVLAQTLKWEATILRKGRGDKPTVVLAQTPPKNSQCNISFRQEVWPIYIELDPAASKTNNHRTGTSLSSSFAADSVGFLKANGHKRQQDSSDDDMLSGGSPPGTPPQARTPPSAKRQRTEAGSEQIRAENSALQLELEAMRQQLRLLTMQPTGQQRSGGPSAAHQQEQHGPRHNIDHHRTEHSHPFIHAYDDDMDDELSQEQPLDASQRHPRHSAGGRGADEEQRTDTGATGTTALRTKELGGGTPAPAEPISTDADTGTIISTNTMPWRHPATTTNTFHFRVLAVQGIGTYIRIDAIAVSGPRCTFCVYDLTGTIQCSQGSTGLAINLLRYVQPDSEPYFLFQGTETQYIVWTTEGRAAGTLRWHNTTYRWISNSNLRRIVIRQGDKDLPAVDKYFVCGHAEGEATKITLGSSPQSESLLLQLAQAVGTYLRTEIGGQTRAGAILLGAGILMEDRPLKPGSYHVYVDRRDFCTTSIRAARPPVIELYAGIAATSASLQYYGLHLTYAIEECSNAAAVIRTNYPGTTVICLDVLAVDFSLLPRHAIIIAGLPCQPYSFIGAGKGLSDARGGRNLLALTRIIRAIEPLFLILEEVEGFKNTAFEILRLELESIGYNVCWGIKDLGTATPQQRRRLIVTAAHSDLGTRIEVAGLCGLGMNRPTLRSILDPDSQQDLEVTPDVQQGYNSFLTTPWPGYRRCYAADDQVPTILTTYSYAHIEFPPNSKWHGFWVQDIGTGPRWLSIAELKRLQTIPSHWTLTGNRRQDIKLIGNAASPLLISNEVGHIVEVLGRWGYRVIPQVRSRIQADLIKAAGYQEANYESPLRLQIAGGKNPRRLGMGSKTHIDEASNLDTADPTNATIGRVRSSNLMHCYTSPEATFPNTGNSCHAAAAIRMSLMAGVCSALLPPPLTWAQAVSILQAIGIINGQQQDPRLTLAELWQKGLSRGRIGEGILQYVATCNLCKDQRALPQDHFTILDLPAPIEQDLHLIGLLSESLQGGSRIIDCSRCGTTNHALQLTQATHDSRTLFMYIKRAGLETKNRRAVHVPPDLSALGMPHQLRAAVLHLGYTSAEGHYVLLVAPPFGSKIRYCHNIDPQAWICLDDGAPPYGLDQPAIGAFSLDTDSSLLLYTHPLSPQQTIAWTISSRQTTINLRKVTEKEKGRGTPAAHGSSIADEREQGPAKRRKSEHSGHANFIILDEDTNFDTDTRTEPQPPQGGGRCRQPANPTCGDANATLSFAYGRTQNRTADHHRNSGGGRKRKIPLADTLPVIACPDLGELSELWPGEDLSQLDQWANAIWQGKRTLEHYTTGGWRTLNTSQKDRIIRAFPTWVTAHTEHFVLARRPDAEQCLAGYSMAYHATTASAALLAHTIGQNTLAVGWSHTAGHTSVWCSKNLTGCLMYMYSDHLDMTAICLLRVGKLKATSSDSNCYMTDVMQHEIVAVLFLGTTAQPVTTLPIINEQHPVSKLPLPEWYKLYCYAASGCDEGGIFRDSLKEPPTRQSLSTSDIVVHGDATLSNRQQRRLARSAIRAAEYQDRAATRLLREELPGRPVSLKPIFTARLRIQGITAVHTSPDVDNEQQQEHGTAITDGNKSSTRLQHRSSAECSGGSAPLGGGRRRQSNQGGSKDKGVTGSFLNRHRLISYRAGRVLQADSGRGKQERSGLHGGQEGRTVLPTLTSAKRPAPYYKRVDRPPALRKLLHTAEANYLRFRSHRQDTKTRRAVSISMTSPTANCHQGIGITYTQQQWCKTLLYGRPAAWQLAFTDALQADTDRCTRVADHKNEDPRKSTCCVASRYLSDTCTPPPACTPCCNRLTPTQYEQYTTYLASITIKLEPSSSSLEDKDDQKIFSTAGVKQEQGQTRTDTAISRTTVTGRKEALTLAQLRDITWTPLRVLSICERTLQLRHLLLGPHLVLPEFGAGFASWAATMTFLTDYLATECGGDTDEKRILLHSGLRKAIAKAVLHLSHLQQLDTRSWEQVKCPHLAGNARNCPECRACKHGALERHCKLCPTARICPHAARMVQCFLCSHRTCLCKVAVSKCGQCFPCRHGSSYGRCTTCCKHLAASNTLWTLTETIHFDHTLKAEVARRRGSTEHWENTLAGPKLVQQDKRRQPSLTVVAPAARLCKHDTAGRHCALCTFQKCGCSRRRQLTRCPDCAACVHRRVYAECAECVLTYISDIRPTISATGVPTKGKLWTFASHVPVWLAAMRSAPNTLPLLPDQAGQGRPTKVEPCTTQGTRPLGDMQEPQGLPSNSQRPGLKRQLDEIELGPYFGSSRLKTQQGSKAGGASAQGAALGYDSSTDSNRSPTIGSFHPVGKQTHKVCVSTLNCGSFANSYPRLFTAEAIDIWALQETGLTHDAVANFGRIASANGWHLHQRGQHLAADGKADRGTAFLCRNSLNVKPLRSLGDINEHLQAGRLEAIQLLDSKGRLQCNLLSVYAPVSQPHSPSHEESVQNDKFLAAVLQFAHSLGGSTVILGDFNREPFDSHPVSSSIMAGFLLDPGNSSSEQDVGRPTHFPRCTAHQARRLDYALFTPDLGSVVQDYQTGDNTFAPDHVPVYFTLPFEPGIVKWQQQLPKELFPSKRPMTTDADRLYFNGSEWQQMLDAGQLDTAFATWSSKAEAVLVVATPAIGGAPKAFLGRGKIPPTRKIYKRSVPCNEDIVRASLMQRRAQKILNLIRELLIKQHELAFCRGVLGRICRLSALLPSEVYTFFQQTELARWHIDFAPMLRDLIDSEARRLATDRIAQWRERMKNLKWQVQWIKGQHRLPPSTVVINGVPCSEPASIFESIFAAWDPITSPQSFTEPLFEEFVREFPGPATKVAWELETELTVEDWSHSLAAAPPAGAPGWCGWHIRELRALPSEYVHALLQLLRAIHRTGCWPTAMATLRTVLIPKSTDEDGAGEAGTNPTAPSPLDLRPLSVASTIVRVWFRIYAKAIGTHLEKTISANHIRGALFGFRAGLSTDDMLAELLNQIHASDTPLYLALLDIVKCFDTIPRELLWALLTALQVDRTIVETLRSFYNASSRSWSYGGHTSPPRKMRRGLYQGLPEAPALLNCILIFLVCRLPGKVVSFADDLKGVASSLIELQAVLHTMARCVELLKMAFAPRKCKWSTNATLSQDHAAVTLAGQTLAFVPDLRVLGFHVFVTKTPLIPTTTGRPAASTTLHTRLRRWIRWLKNGISLPINFAQLSKLLVALAPALYYGLVSECRTTGITATLRRQLIQALLRSSSMRPCAEVFDLLLIKAHLLSPAAVPTYQACRFLLRAATTYPHALSAWLVSHGNRPTTHASLGNVVVLTQCLLRRIGLSLTEIGLSGANVTLRDVVGELPNRFDLLAEAAGAAASSREFYAAVKQYGARVKNCIAPILHNIRAAIRNKDSRDAALRRPREFAGLLQADRVRTCQRLQLTTVSAIEATALRTVLLGGTITASRANRRSPDIATRICPFCDSGTEEVELHRWIDCTAWTTYRQGYEDDIQNILRLPVCAQVCGIILSHFSKQQADTVARYQIMIVNIELAVNATLQAAVRIPAEEEEQFDLVTAYKHQILLSIARAHGITAQHVARATRFRAQTIRVGQDRADNAQPQLATLNRSGIQPHFWRHYSAAGGAQVDHLGAGYTTGNTKQTFGPVIGHRTHLPCGNLPIRAIHRGSSYGSSRHRSSPRIISSISFDSGLLFHLGYQDHSNCGNTFIVILRNRILSLGCLRDRDSQRDRLRNLIGNGDKDLISNFHTYVADLSAECPGVSKTRLCDTHYTEHDLNSLRFVLFACLAGCGLLWLLRFSFSGYQVYATCLAAFASTIQGIAHSTQQFEHAQFGLWLIPFACLAGCRLHWLFCFPVPACQFQATTIDVYTCTTQEAAHIFRIVCCTAALYTHYIRYFDIFGADPLAALSRLHFSPKPSTWTIDNTRTPEQAFVGSWLVLAACSFGCSLLWLIRLLQDVCLAIPTLTVQETVHFGRIACGTAVTNLYQINDFHTYVADSLAEYPGISKIRPCDTRHTEHEQNGFRLVLFACLANCGLLRLFRFPLSGYQFYASCLADPAITTQGPAHCAQQFEHAQFGFWPTPFARLAGCGSHWLFCFPIPGCQFQATSFAIHACTTQGTAQIFGIVCCAAALYTHHIRYLVIYGADPLAVLPRLHCSPKASKWRVSFTHTPEQDSVGSRLVLAACLFGCCLLWLIRLLQDVHLAIPTLTIQETVQFCRSACGTAVTTPSQISDSHTCVVDSLAVCPGVCKIRTCDWRHTVFCLFGFWFVPFACLAGCSLLWLFGFLFSGHQFFAACFAAFAFTAKGTAQSVRTTIPACFSRNDWFHILLYS